MSDTKNITPDGMKMQALLERIAELTAEYENKIADLRVAYTVVSQQLEDANASLAEFKKSEDAAE